ncbi:MAG: hypothetical protein PHE83_05030 [Opitutaceae bacterium]|nr:hypothetical protein [Opitutaceae bacterium]
MLAFAVDLTADETQAPAPPPMDDVPLDRRYAQVTVDPTSTSIYIGSVSLAMPPFARRNGVYSTDYTARVSPFFFYNERGHISIEFSDDNLRQLMRGETVYFKGRALNHDGEERRIEGRAIPAGAGHGKIKVRVWVGRIELIFNSVYRFTGAE